ncbi:hypothetical protein FACS189449_04490 [Alphaproteobacteria bacterium]|nr:hypothetical protein FACS189449_04490 [Alphaproteobacteria bacterium]
MDTLRMNYFDVLEIPASYKIDQQAVIRTYLKKQRTSHPDMCATHALMALPHSEGYADCNCDLEAESTSQAHLAYNSEDSDSISAGAANTGFLRPFGATTRVSLERSDGGCITGVTLADSASTLQAHLAYNSEGSEALNGASVTLVNEAYSVIMNPVLRAEYFLRLKGIDPDAVTTSKSAYEILEIREEFESMDSDIEKEKFLAYLHKRVSNLLEALYKSDDDIQEFSDNFTLLRFIKSFLEKVAPNAYSGN